ncbi:oligosaccharide flippase family protein [Microbacterium sp. ABRD28]|uniref:oligosaccharide flippase family protein n=1 Tax=Microbacterium sp. ABRD28 TaxID=2268461 RepID=UPI000F557D31|nr:oligosaccharide flippase family protein [Microbacterium sp. ABRD28]
MTRPLSARMRPGLLGGASVLSLTMVAVSAVNYGLNVVLVRLLDPAQFGDVALAITVVLTASVVAATLQMVASRSVAADPASAPAVRRVLLRAASVAGAAALVLLGGGAWILADLLRTSSPWIFVIIAAGLPVYFLQAVHRGLLQGQLRFTRVAASYAAEAGVRLLIAVTLVMLGFGPIGAALGIFASFLASAAVAWTRRPESGSIKTAAAALGTAVASASMMLLAQALVNNADVVVAKALFAPAAAGAYAAAAVLCRSLYFLAWTVIQVSVPLLASAATAAARRRIILVAGGVICALGVLGVIAAATVGDEAVRIVFGPAYGAATVLLVPSVLCATVLSASTFIAAVDLAAGRSGTAAVLLGGAVLQVPILMFLATDPLSLILFQVLTMTLTLAGQGVLVVSRRMRRPTLRPHAGELHPTTPTVSAK